LKEDENNKAAKMKKGDTLDYYNDALPKKAVESLFDKRDKNTRPDDDYEDEDISGDTGYDEPEKEIVIQEKLAYKERTRDTSNIDADLEEQISMHPRARGARPRRDVYAAEEKFRQGIGASLTGDLPRRQGEEAPRQQTPEQTRRPAPATDDLPRRRPPEETTRRPVSEHTRDHTRRAPTDDMPRPSSSSYPEETTRRTSADSRSGESARRRGQYPNTTGSRAATSRLFGDEEFNNDSSLPIKLIIAFGSAIVVLVLIVVLIVKINSLNADLAKVQNDIDTKVGEKVSEGLTQKDIEIDGYKDRIKELEDENKALRESQSPAPVDGVEPQDPANPAGSDNPPPITTPVNTNPPGETTTYTVVSGDNLSKIALRYYGSDSRANVNKIKEANGLTSDTINVGLKLIIP